MNDIPMTTIPLPESSLDDVAAPVMTTANGLPAVWSEESARLLHEAVQSGEPRPITPAMQDAIRTYRRLTHKKTVEQ